MGNPEPVSVMRPPSTARSGVTEAMVGLNFLLGIVQLDVPIQIVTPAFWRVAQPDRDANRRRRIRSPRGSEQLHSGFGRRTSALEPVAANTAGDDVFPVFAAALRDGHYVVEREVSRREPPAAVLAGVMVACVNVRAREGNVIEAAFDFDEAKQADDGRKLESERDRPHLAVVNRDHLHFSLAPQRNSLLPVNYLQRLIRGVQ